RNDRSRHLVARQHRREQEQSRSEHLDWLRTALDRRHELCVDHADLSRKRGLRPARRRSAEEGDSVSRPVLWISWTLAATAVVAQSPPTYIPDIKFATGRSVVPYLEGWIRNPDETFDFVFGYFNRNTEEELVIPPGPDNSVMPDGPDRGQPTYFAPRRQPRIFRVRVPKDWGDKAITWSITANGVTEKVVSKLLPAEEINEHIMIANGNNTMRFGEEDLNKPPTLALAPI